MRPIVVEDQAVESVRVYYQDATTTLYHAPSADVLASLPDESIGAVLTDPVYTNFNYVREWEARLIPFDPAVDGRWITDLLQWYIAWVPHLARVTGRGSGFVFLHPHYLPFFARVCTFLDWPITAHDALPPERLIGLGDVRPLTGPIVGNRYGADKSVDMLRTVIQALPPSDQPLIDPFMGNGSSLLAARREGWSVVGMDTDEACCERAAKALMAGVYA